MTELDVLERQIEEGNEARLIHQYAGKRLLEREEHIVRTMLKWFRSIHTTPALNSPEIGVRFIAQLSEVRALLEDTEQREEKGAKAMATLVSKSTASDEQS